MKLQLFYFKAKSCLVNFTEQHFYDYIIPVLSSQVILTRVLFFHEKNLNHDSPLSKE
jgi:hypothetical protein